MKFKSICLATIAGIALLASCKNDGDAARDAAVQSVQATQPAGDAAANPAANPATPTTPEPAQNPSGVWHYTCPKGCAGGAGSAIACSNCGTTLAHNQAYHGVTPTATPQTIQPTKDSRAVALPEGMTPIESPIKTPEPAQNAKGVWHYTCSGGCAGGAGSAVACQKCGKTLAHNQAYHL